MQAPNLQEIDTIIGHVRGPKGDPGEMPEITVTDITGGHRVTITVGEEEPIVFDVMDGEKGDKGDTGDTGDDGVSPAVTVTNITGGHRVTITDAEHPAGQTFDVMDGASAYEQAVAGGYTGTEAQFNQELQSFKTLSEQAAGSATAAASAKTAAEAAQTAAVAAKTATETAMDTAVSTLQTEGAAQRTAIQQKGQEVIASIPEDYTDLSDEVADLKSAFEENGVEDIPKIKEKLTLVKSANVFNKNDVANGYLDGTGAVVEDNNNTTSNFIAVTPGDVVKTYYVSSGVVVAANMATICGYNEGKVFVIGTRQTYVNTLTVPAGVSFIRFTVGNGMVETYMLIVNGEQPTAYIPYKNYYVATSAFIDDAISTYDFADRPISKEETDFWKEEKSANLYNVDDIVLNEFFNSNGSTQENQNVARAFVALDGAGTYAFNVDGAFFGLSNALNIPCFDKSKNYVKYITATTEDTTGALENLCSLVISETDISDGVAYVGFTMAITLYETEMFVKGSTYPQSFIPYYRYWTMPDLVSVSKNPLFGKQIIFDGDSICAGLGSAMGDYGNGWAGRIGVDYGANAVNVGVSGACITAETYFDGGAARHWISRYIDTIHTNYPDADYIIAEGGTNDADNFYGDASKLGTFDEADFTGPFDDTTFYGAMDSWCKKALTYFPKAKIGFIVAQKMGTGFVTYVKNRFDYFGYASKVCKKWGIPVLNLWNDGQLRPDVISMYDPQYNTIETATAQGLLYYDGQHLTAYGYDVISPKIAEWMKTL